MKKLLNILLICFTSLSFGQIYEFGIFTGASNVISDIGSMNYVHPNAFSGGLIFKYNANPRIAVRLNYTYIGLKGEDNASENPFRNQRNINFTNNLHEFAFGTEFNFFEYDIKDPKIAYTPYILTQIAGFSYESPKDLVDNKLRSKNKMGFSIPVGLGFKGRISDHFAFAIEAGIRFTFTDDLDYTTTDIPQLNFGGQGNDHYLFTGLSVVYSFGRKPCYANRP